MRSSLRKPHISATRVTVTLDGEGRAVQIAARAKPLLGPHLASRRSAALPSLLLQPLIENSIRCAVEGRDEGGSIHIAARVFADNLLIEISDDRTAAADRPSAAAGAGAAAIRDPKVPGDAESGLARDGLAGVSDRLRQFYGDNHACTVGAADVRGARVNIRIPFETAEAAG